MPLIDTLCKLCGAADYVVGGVCLHCAISWNGKERTEMNTFVAFSGGADSTALALLMPDATPIFTDTGDEFDAIYSHIDKFEQTTGREVVRIQATETLPEYEKRAKFLPNHGARFCTRMFKIEPMNAYLTDHLPATLYIGLRADEPEELRAGNLTDMQGLSIRYPLREMGYGRMEVVRTCLKYDLLPRYPPYMARGGCKGCFYKRYSEVVAMHYLSPETLDELQAREETVQDARGAFFHMFPNVGMSIKELRAALAEQPFLMSLEDVYRAAGQSDDKGAACGLFCHR